MDADDNESLDITDPIYILSFLFLNGPPPSEPFPVCGVDSTDLGKAPEILLCAQPRCP
jgi:hypothetical protein